MTTSQRKATPGDDGVSPVLGTILMVAITVVLAGVVAVMVNVLSRPPESEPDLVLVQSGGGNQTVYTVIDAPTPPLDWAAFTNSTWGGSDCTAVLPTGTLDAGDQIIFAGSAGDCVGVLYTLVDTSRGRVAFQDTI